MMKKRKIVSVLSIITILLCCTPVSATVADPVDEYLISIGFPPSVLSTMLQSEKEMIYEHTVSENAVYCGYDTKEFVIDDENGLSEINNEAATPRGGIISPSDMTLSVTAIKSTDIDGNTLYYTVYPTFKWHTLVVLSNDSFAMSMYSGWEAIPGERNLRIHNLDSEGVSTTYIDLSPTGASSTGYSYKVPGTYCQFRGWYAGHARYRIEKVSATASPRISLYYAHDKSPLFDASYSLNVGVGSISITGNTNWIYEMADNFEVPRLET